METLKVLLGHRPPLDLRDGSFEGTPLEWALYAWGTTPNRVERHGSYEFVALLAAAGAALDPKWLDADEDRGFPLGAWVRTLVNTAA